jgi:hypothetical protein
MSKRDLYDVIDGYRSYVKGDGSISRKSLNQRFDSIGGNSRSKINLSRDGSPTHFVFGHRDS